MAPSVCQLHSTRPVSDQSSPAFFKANFCAAVIQSLRKSTKVRQVIGYISPDILSHLFENTQFIKTVLLLATFPLINIALIRKHTIDMTHS